MPKQAWAAVSTLRRLATAGARVRPLKTPGWQKMFMSRASELLAESSSRHCQSLRARERRGGGGGVAGGARGAGEAAEPGGVGADAGVGCGVEVAVAALLVAAEDDYGVGAGGDVVEEILGAG